MQMKHTKNLNPKRSELGTTLSVLHDVDIFLDTTKECLVLQHGLTTISKVSQATEEELMDCSLDHKTAKKIINFFENDCIQI